MIKVEERKNLKLIISSVSDFSDSMGYCEHKIPFHLEGVIPPPSVATIQGSQAHEKEEQIEKEQFVFVPISDEELKDMNQNIEFAREKLSTRLLLPLRIQKERFAVLLHGRADKIFRLEQTLVVQEDKFPSNFAKYEDRVEPYDNYKLQALTYLNSMFTDTNSWNPKEWFEISHKEKAWIINIRDKNNENKTLRIFKGMQNREATKFLLNSIERFAFLVLGLEERRHHNIPAKCKPCRLYDQCQFRL